MTTSHPPQSGYGPRPRAHRKTEVRNLSKARSKILEILDNQLAPVSVQELSLLTRQHENTIREHLDFLVDADLAIRELPSDHRRGRPAWLYRVNTEFNGLSGSGEYAGLASALAGQIARTSKEPRKDAIEAGRIWGKELIGRASGSRRKDASLRSGIRIRETVVNFMKDLGFAPSPDSQFIQVKLTRCPLLDAAYQYPDVVCAVHLGLVRGALEALGTNEEQIEKTELQSFSERGSCKLSLMRSIPSPSRQHHR